MTLPNYEVLKAGLEDTVEAIAEGGQYYQIGDRQFRRADLRASFEILNMLAHQQQRIDTNNGFMLVRLENSGSRSITGLGNCL